MSDLLDQLEKDWDGFMQSLQKTMPQVAQKHAGHILKAGSPQGEWIEQPGRDKVVGSSPTLWQPDQPTGDV